MFWIKFFVVKQDILLAICDKDMIGKKLKTDDHKLEVKEDFYGGKLIEDEETVVNLMKSCTIANLIGKDIVAVAIKHGFITEENIISIGGVPHAQFVKL